MSRHFIIHPLLVPYVHSIEVVSSEYSDVPYKVYPELFVVMGFQYQGQLNTIIDNNEREKLNWAGVTGLLTQYKRFQAATDFTKTILIKFNPWGVPALFNESAEIFTNQSLSLADLIIEKKVKLLQEEVQLAFCVEDMVNIIQNFLLVECLNRCKAYKGQQRITQIAQYLAHNPSIKNLEEIALSYGYSRRSLERQFKLNIGLSPKKYVLTARFMETQNKLNRGSQWEDISASLNYYDQAHFIKEFKQFTGITPRQYQLANN